MNLHHLSTCIHSEVQDKFKDVVLPCVGFAWHLRREELLAALNLDSKMSFAQFRMWCMQPIPSDFLLGSWSNVHLAFEVAVNVKQLLPG